VSQADYFLKLEGIKGESQDEKHRDEIELLSASFGVISTGLAGPGAGANRPGKIQDIVITKHSDRSSTALMQFAINGKPIKKGKITFRKAGEPDPLEYMTIEMENIIITSVSVQTDAKGRATEAITLSFTKMTVTYIPQGTTGGPGGGATTFVHDANTPGTK
jgi:type VI secretion system secreted protein Hcp